MMTATRWAASRQTLHKARPDRWVSRCGDEPGLGPFGVGRGLAGGEHIFPFGVGKAGGEGCFEFVMAEDRAGEGGEFGAVIDDEVEEVHFANGLVQDATGIVMEGRGRVGVNIGDEGVVFGSAVFEFVSVGIIPFDPDGMAVEEGGIPAGIGADAVVVVRGNILHEVVYELQLGGGERLVARMLFGNLAEFADVGSEAF